MKKIFLLSLVAVLLFSFSGCGKKKTEDVSKPPEEENQKYREIVEDSREFSGEVKPLVKVYEGELTNYGQYNYSGQLYQSSAKTLENRLKLDGWTTDGLVLMYPLKSYNVIYQKDNKRVAISGAETVDVNGLLSVDGINCFKVRDTTTGHLLFIYENGRDIQEGEKNFILGDLYATGKKYPAENTIVVNRRVLPGKTFMTDRDGRYWLPIEAVLNARGIETRAGKFTMTAEYLGREFFIPTPGINKGIYARKDTLTDEFYIDGMTWGGNFKCRVNVDGELYGEAEMLSRYFGMEIEVSDELVVVTTDPYDIPIDFYYVEDNGAITEIENHYVPEI